MKENTLRSFMRETYNGSSPVPYIITVQVLVFVLIHIVDLLSFSEITDQGLFNMLHAELSLPSTFGGFIQQPWSFVTHTVVYDNLFRILFDCLWLYWIGQLFLTFLVRRQFWTVFGGGLLGGSLLYLIAGHLAFIPGGQYWNSMALGLVALITAVTTLLPTYELRLLLFGNVRLRTVAAIYVAFELVVKGWPNPQLILPILFAAAFGLLFVRQLQAGKDWSTILRVKKRQKLQVVHRSGYSDGRHHRMAGPPTQEQVDQILDKISKSGYDSLTSAEKEVLFKASKQDQE